MIRQSESSKQLKTVSLWNIPPRSRVIQRESVPQGRIGPAGMADFFRNLKGKLSDTVRLGGRQGGPIARTMSEGTVH